MPARMLGAIHSVNERDVPICGDQISKLENPEPTPLNACGAPPSSLTAAVFARAREIIDTTALKGSEIAETSAAKDLVANLFYDEKWDEQDGDRDAPYGIDVIDAADDIVETLIRAGWRPTQEARV